MRKEMPVVALMGKANAGKSTLMNRIATKASAIVDPTPGVTRDRKYATAVWRSRQFQIVDTGGVGAGTEDRLRDEVEKQAFIAALEADVVLMLVDVKTGVTEDDLWLSRRIKRENLKPVLVVNKVDNESMLSEASRFYSLGLGDPVEISAYHGLGISDLLDRIVEALPDCEHEEMEPETAIAIVGRPNVGKSSIVNNLAEEYRSLVHEEPHTTRDTVDTLVENDGVIYRLLDTAGMRRKKTGMSDLEYYSSLRTLRAIDEADVVLLVIDGLEGPTENDQKIAREILEKGRSLALIINKWDLAPEREGDLDFMESVSYKFRFIKHLPLLRVSALTGRSMQKIFPLVDSVKEEWKKRVPTPELNDFIEKVKAEYVLPAKGGRHLKLYYASQTGTAPPAFTIIVNNSDLVKSDYRRFIEGRIRQEYGFAGCPVKVYFKTSSGRRIKDSV